MLSKKVIQRIQSLQKRKFRQLYCHYLVEGDKIVFELLQSQQDIEHIYALESWITLHQKTIEKQKIAFTVISENELMQISSLKAPQEVIALATIPTPSLSIHTLLPLGKYVVLDKIQDPGNLGTIIRSAHWFGVEAIFCAEGTVDVYNPKVVQATMGSLFHIPIIYTSVIDLLKKQSHLPIYAAVLNGQNIYETTIAPHFFLIIGNESKGISLEIQEMAQHRLTIPKFSTAESLNAAVSCSIILALAHQKNKA